MTTPPPPEGPPGRRAGPTAFAIGTAASLAFFAFFPTLPHVIDWGAVTTSLLIGAATRWAWLARPTKARPDHR
ncbi:hypothetical protein [Streptomyces sp. NPDC091268]|uniref:hypothetical protein n=1 Tax=Streptomyces sp. NPDC091268 TaxID=3365979 RepID=UPI0037F1DE12